MAGPGPALAEAFPGRGSPVRLSRLLVVIVLLAPLPAAAASEAEAEALMRRLEQEAVAMAAPALPMAEKERRFRALLQTSFDLPGVSRFILGPRWRTASPPQRQEFVSLFEDITVDIWVPRFRDYGGQRLDVLDVQPTGDGFMVASVVRNPEGRDTPVTWRLVDTRGGLKVADIVVEGVSMALTHRSEYASVMRQAGGIDGLLGRMRQQVARSQ